MACMAHSCTNDNCDFESFNNNPYMICPLCGHPCNSTFDEQANGEDYIWLDEYAEFNSEEYDE